MKKSVSRQVGWAGVTVRGLLTSSPVSFQFSVFIAGTGGLGPATSTPSLGLSSSREAALDSQRGHVPVCVRRLCGVPCMQPLSRLRSPRTLTHF